mgnify:CR=1 FL=1
MKRLWLSIILTLLLISCQKPANEGGMVEITETDVFSLPDYHSLEITVNGVKLGDSEQQVLTKLGQPDNTNTYNDAEGKIVNFEYKKAIETEKIGLVIHTVNDRVQRITIKQPFNKYLKGKTRIVPEYEKEDLFELLGTPTSKEIMKPFTVYRFEDKGIEVFYNEKGWNGFALVVPKEVDLSKVYTNLQE